MENVRLRPSRKRLGVAVAFFGAAVLAFFAWQWVRDAFPSNARVAKHLAARLGAERAQCRKADSDLNCKLVWREFTLRDCYIGVPWSIPEDGIEGCTRVGSRAQVGGYAWDDVEAAFAAEGVRNARISVYFGGYWRERGLESRVDARGIHVLLFRETATAAAQVPGTELTGLLFGLAYENDPWRGEILRRGRILLWHNDSLAAVRVARRLDVALGKLPVEIRGE